MLQFVVSSVECIIYFCTENKCMPLRNIPQLYTIKSERNTAMVTLWQICKCSSQEGSLRLAVLGPKQFEALEDPGSRGSRIPSSHGRSQLSVAPVQSLRQSLLVSTIHLLPLFCLPTPHLQNILSQNMSCDREHHPGKEIV